MIRITSHCFRLPLAVAVVATLLAATVARGAGVGGTTSMLTYATSAQIGFGANTPVPPTGTFDVIDLSPYLCLSPACPGIVVTGLTLTYTANPNDNTLTVPLIVGWSAQRLFTVSPPPLPPFLVQSSSHLDGFLIYDATKFTVNDLSLHSVANDSDPTTLHTSPVPSSGCSPPVLPPKSCFSLNGDILGPPLQPDHVENLFNGGNAGLLQFFQMTFSQMPTTTNTDKIELRLPGSVISNLLPVIPVVPFAAFAARLEVERHEDQFELDAVFNLGATSDGIQPLTEDVKLQIGTFPVTIPAGSFRAGEDENDGGHRDGMDRDKPGHEDHDRRGRQRARFTFEGVFDGVSLEVKLIQTGASTFKLKAEGRGANLSGIVNPVTIGVAIGDDGGSISIMADFDE